MEGESGATWSMIDELHSSDNQADQMEDESGVTWRIIDQIHSSDIQGGQMESENGVTRNIIEEYMICSKNYNWFINLNLRHCKLW